MIDTQDLEKIIALTLASGYIEGDKPLSLMIISDRPESGKTEMVLEFTGCKPEGSVAYATDITAYGLWRDLSDRIRIGSLKHLVIPEMITPLNKNRATAGHLVSTLQTLIEDGVYGLHTGFLKQKQLAGGVIGIICCMPRTTYLTYRGSWALSGFLSRFVVVSYRQGDSTVDAVFRSIRKGEYLEATKQELVFPDNPVCITIPDNVGSLCENLAREVTEEARKKGELYGYREVKNIRRLVAANVILENQNNHEDRDTAQIRDFELVGSLSYLFNEQFNEVRK